MKALLSYHKEPRDPKEQLKFVASMSGAQAQYLSDILKVLDIKAAEKYGRSPNKEECALINDCKIRSKIFYDELYGWQRRCYDEWLDIHMMAAIKKHKKEETSDVGEDDESSGGEKQ